ncbi:alpha-amylase family glycosyl hydrolase [Brevundimonas subvibrioides]|uniref:Alpha amylase catalytic region n=1 Tax=Brevundimonas subvibrioides (strain ATCC 15264 / DSM 4735 / LMG 14903 / NBRC 16000 / CB 81) TaxID=633149 RepID=D9QNH6_BRESC|nr:alpha-amylase family glycosyl hydrolase [Brevundimonas subvibrioides]ADL02211.1 alpha amylase catalytic region [Brevundimonas subvibrioides ATCC 15264]
MTPARGSIRRTSPAVQAAAAVLAALTVLTGGAPGHAQTTPDYRARLPQDEVIYFLMPDRFDNGDPANDTGGLPGGRLDHGFDPTDEGFYHGGDLAGVERRLDYLQGLGATAIWMAPIFRNKPVQGEPGREFAGAHGYWITDFTRVDPHFGDEAAMHALVDAAHARGMKVYMDIVANHTADVIRYRECPANDCAYRSRADYPFTRRGGITGAAINEGFDGSNFDRLTRSDYAYTPYVPEGEAAVKVPAWLNDPAYYHNRGDTTFRGESSTDGDFAGLDDLLTEHPRVVSGMIEIFGDWIDRYGIDGFRIDTAKHVNSAFWQAFVPAMLERARARGIPNFHIFGEVYDVDPAVTARFTRVDGYPAVLDFPFQFAVTDIVARDVPPTALAKVFDADALYEGGATGALGLPTFLGNHDMGRIGGFILAARPDISDAELLQRQTLAHALMMFSRGVPTLYYGDEQGFTGSGGYGGARQDMADTRVASYRDNRIVGGARPPFATDAPLYRAISEMARLRQADVRLRRGLQTVRFAAEAPGILALSRRIDAMPGETLIIYNTSAASITANIEIDAASTRWSTARGECPAAASAPGSLRVTVPAFDYLICSSEGAR